jgi:hypothetical protein
MSDQPTTPGTGEQATPDNDEATPKPTETVDFWKSKAREQEKRAKDNAKAAERLAEIEEATKSESQKAADKIAAETQRANEAEARLLRYEVAAEKGIPAKAIKLLSGASREEIEASAAEVLELIGEAGKPRTPKPDPNQGRQGSSSTSNGELFAAAIEGSFTR